MSRSALAFALPALLLVAPAAQAEPSRWVLPAEAAGPLSQLLGLADGFGDATLSARIGRDVVEVFAVRGDEELLRVTLRHPSAADEGATVVAGFALDRTPGPAPDDLVAALIVRMGEGEVAWREQVREPAPALRPGEPGPRGQVGSSQGAGAERRLRARPAELTVGQRVRAPMGWRLLERPEAPVRVAGEAPPEAQSPPPSDAPAAPTGLPTLVYILGAVVVVLLGVGFSLVAARRRERRMP